MTIYNDQGRNVGIKNPIPNEIDLDALKQIPIVDVASLLGLDIVKTGAGVWAMREQGSKTPTSLILFEKTNTWKRFSGIEENGFSNGSTIDLVMAFGGYDFKTAIEFLSNFSPTSV